MSKPNDIFKMQIFSSETFIPHGHCYLWKTELVWFHIISDASIALAYYSIPIALIYFVRKRKDLPFNWIFFLFGAFIIACGTSHLMEIWTLWHPTYWLSGLLKAITALVSIYTALALLPLVPKALALPSPTQLEKVNKELEHEIIERKLVEEALRESEERFRNAFDYAAIGMALVALDGRWVQVNRSLCEIVGYTEQELLSTSFQAITHPDDLECDLNYANQLLSGEIRCYQIEKRYFHSSGHIVWILLSGSLVRNAVGEPLYFIAQIQDITERKQIEAALQESEERWQLALRGNNDGIWDWNVKTNEVFFSARWKEMLGYEEHEISNHLDEWAQRVHPDDLAWVTELIQGHFAKKTPFYISEHRVLCKDGTYKWILDRGQALWDEKGNVTRMTGSHTDITERKLAEEKLRKSEANLVAAQRVAHVGSWEFDLLAQKLTWSEENFRIFGLDPTKPEPTYAELLQLIHPDDQASWHKSAEQVFANGGLYACDFRIVQPNGQIRYAEGRAEALINEQGQVIRLFGTTVDITERRQAEEQLRWQEALLRSMTDASPLAFYVVNNRTDTILYFNHRFCEIWGIEHLEEQMQQGILKNNDIIPDCLPLLANVSAFAESCKPLQSEENRVVVEDEIAFVNERTIRRFSAQVRDGEDRYFGRLYIFEDITQRKQAEERLRLLERAVAASNNGILISDAQVPDHPVIYVNSGFERITGYTKEEVIGKNCRFLQGSDKAQPALEKLRHAIISGSETQVVLRNYRKNGSLFWNEFCITPVHDETGSLTHFIGVQTDISDRKQAEEALRQSEVRERKKAKELERTLGELKRTQAQLIQAEKMSSLGQMVAGIAHEINNPVGFIYANITLAAEYVQDLLHLVELYQQHYPNPVAEIAEQIESVEPVFIKEDFPKLLGSMKEGADRISQIVGSLRNFSRLDEAQRKQVDIHEGIENTLFILQQRLKLQPERSEIQVIREYGQLPRVECYPGELNQVFMNILCNAIDALDELAASGQLSGVSEKSNNNAQLTRDFRPTIRICTDIANTSRVVIRIADNGGAIKAEVLPKIFDPFFTTKPPGKGTGLGLFICYQIVVDKHSGELTCHSVAGQGTEFVIELPIVQDQKPGTLLSQAPQMAALSWEM